MTPVFEPSEAEVIAKAIADFVHRSRVANGVTLESIDQLTEDLKCVRSV